MMDQGEASQNSSIQGGAGPRSKTRPRRRRRTFTPEIRLLIALITAITPIVVAWLTYQASLPKPTPIPIVPPVITPSLTELPTESPVVVVTDTVTPIVLPSRTSTIFVTPTFTETTTGLPRPKLIVFLTVNKTSGKAPLTVKLDARASYLTDYDGQTHVCRNGSCHYTWKVYSNGQQIGKSVTGSGGTFDYKFGKKGTYTVTVWICRGQDGIDCGGNGIQIVVT